MPLGRSDGPGEVSRVYRLRFGIETSYRQMNRCGIRATRNPAIRPLFVAVALLLRSL
jgi:hypothetical protein